MIVKPRVGMKLRRSGSGSFFDGCLGERFRHFFVGLQIHDRANKKEAGQRHFGPSQHRREMIAVAGSAYDTFRKVNQNEHGRPLHRVDIALQNAT